MKVYLPLLLTILLTIGGFSVATMSSVQVVNRPFPQHETYAAGTIRPSNFTQAQQDQHVRDFYDYWKGQYLVDAGTNGAGEQMYRVAFGSGSTVTVSEGQGYGLIATAIMAGHDPDAQTLFDGLYRFAREYPSGGDSRLMSWKVDNGVITGGNNNAFDGDLDIAYGLLLADAQWGSGGAINYATAADEVIDGILASNIGPASRLTMLGDWVNPNGSPHSQYTPRSSDMVAAHFRAFGRSQNNPTWQTVIANNNSAMQTIQANHSPVTGLLPDFIINCNTACTPAYAGFLEGSHDGHYYYNAGRDPWRIALDVLLNGDADAKAIVDKMVTWVESSSGGNANNIKAGYELNGTPIGNYFTSFFVAPFGVGAMVDGSHQTFLNNIYASVYNRQESYFEDSVNLLALLVMTGNYWDPTATTAPPNTPTPTATATATPLPTNTPTPDPNATPATSNLPFYETYVDRSAEPPLLTNNPLPTTGGTAITLHISPTNVLRDLPRGLFGNNAAVWLGNNTLLTQTAKDRLSMVDTPMLRFPGGSTSDKYHWDGNYPSYAVAQGWDVMSQNWAVNTYEFLTFAEELDIIPVMVANHGYAVYDTTATNGNVNNAAQLAADWVEYCNAPNDGSNPNGGTDWAAQRAADGHPEPFNVRYWEVGNEVFGSWEVGYQANGADYAANYNVIYDAMKAVDPTIFVGIVGAFEGDSAWFADVLSYGGTADRIDFIDVHNYYHWYGNNGENPITEAAILDLTDIIADNKAELDQLVADNTSRDAIPYYYGEFNGTNPVNFHHVQLVNGLFTAKALGEMITEGFAGTARWDIYNSWSNNGDLGFLSRNNPSIPDHTPYAGYYPYYFYTRNFGDHLVASSSSDADVSVYASTFTSGDVGVVIVNESAENKTATLNLHDFTTENDLNAWVLTGDSLASNSLTLNGVGNGYTYGGPLIEDVTAYHWQVGNTSQLTVNLEKNAVISLLIYGQDGVPTAVHLTQTTSLLRGAGLPLLLLGFLLILSLRFVQRHRQ